MSGAAKPPVPICGCAVSTSYCSSVADGPSTGGSTSAEGVEEIPAGTIPLGPAEVEAEERKNALIVTAAQELKGPLVIPTSENVTRADSTGFGAGRWRCPGEVDISGHERLQN